MDRFLQMVAADLYQRMRADLSRTVVVFPGKRAMLYFNEYLAQEAGGPVWTPTYMSISDLFSSLSAKRLGDPVKLVCLLHQVFGKASGKTEPLDDFYFWGEMLLHDFDDVDKSMADAKDLFRNLQELKQLDDLTSIPPEQREALSHFFGIFAGGGSSELKRNFSNIWNSLHSVYLGFRSLLASQGIAYEGMLFREVVESLDTGHLPFDRYVFVGFNVLTRVEHKLFSKLQSAGKALFYWDYDASYISQPDHEAATFLSRNIVDFPSPLSAGQFRALSRPKTVQYVEASTENAQARYLSQWLPENLTSPERDTAIVLCNEALLSPVLHSLPPEVRNVNVTMGYPLGHTPAYSFVCAIMEAHAQGFRPSQVRNLTNHPFLRRLSPDDAERVLTPATDQRQLCSLLLWALEAVGKTFAGVPDTQEPDPLLPIYKESIFEAYTMVNRFTSLVDEGHLASIRLSSFTSLVQRAMSSVRIPFHGEPAEGVQIMGLIETRNLDFRHLVMLSASEGFMPRVANDVSFIPYNLRKAFGLTTIEHKISVYAYYFYRLLQRAETVTLVHNTVTDDKHKGEMSRFMLQLLVESPYPIQRLRLEPPPTPEARQYGPVPIQKTLEVMQALRRRFDLSVNGKSILSPSALNAYIDCPLRFYYTYVAGLRLEQEADEGVDNAMFGTIFHEAAQDLYEHLATPDSPLVTREKLLPYLTDGGERLSACVDCAFRREYFSVSPDHNVHYNGLQLINRDVITRFLHMLLQTDLKHTPFTFLAAEQEVRESFTVAAEAQTQPFTLNIGGTIDRQDILQDGTLRIVDYKTGGQPKTFKGTPDLFEQKRDRANYIFQIFLYSTLVMKRNPQRRLQPLLLYIHHAAAPDYNELIQCTTAVRGQYDDLTAFTPELASGFRAELDTLLNAHIFNPTEPFTPTTIADNCKHCDFRTLCHRTPKN